LDENELLKMNNIVLKLREKLYTWIHRNKIELNTS